MRMIPVSQLCAGQILGQIVYNTQMLPALRPGTVLLESQIRWLKENGYRSTYIDDGLELADPYPLIPDKQYIMGFRLIGELYSISEKIMRAEAEGDPNKSRDLFRLRSHRDELLEDLIEWSGRTITEISRYSSRLWERSFVKSQHSYNISHSLSTALIATLMGLDMRMNFKQIQALFVASILAEVGNLTIPQEILFKQGRLTTAELDLVKGHCYNSYIQIKSCAELDHLIRLICLEHHERVDGTGYPGNLKDQEIHILAKVLAVADAYDAMNSDRSYRQAYLPHKALELMAQGVGTRYDTEAFMALKAVVLAYPVGTLVSLDDGSCGVVSGAVPGRPDQPMLRILAGGILGDPTALSRLPGRRITGIRHMLPDSGHGGAGGGL